MSDQKANLDAWRVLQTVVDAGGFAQAASQLDRSQSAISYSISKLEQQLQIELLTIQGRRAVLTETGQRLLTRARQLLTDYHDLIGYAAHLQNGDTAKINLWLDGICPIQRIQKALLAFRQQSPHTRLKIQHGLGSADLNQADIVISPSRLPDKNHLLLDTIELLAVAHPHHPLFALDCPIHPSSLKPFIRVILESEQQLTTEQSWPVTTVHQAKEYIESGLAFGWLPVEMVTAEINTGLLQPVPLKYQQHDRISLYLQYPLTDAKSESLQRLVKLIKAGVDKQEINGMT